MTFKLPPLRPPASPMPDRWVPDSAGAPVETLYAPGGTALGGITIQQYDGRWAGFLTMSGKVGAYWKPEEARAAVEKAISEGRR